MIKGIFNAAMTMMIIVLVSMTYSCDSRKPIDRVGDDMIDYYCTCYNREIVDFPNSPTSERSRKCNSEVFKKYGKIIEMTTASDAINFYKEGEILMTKYTEGRYNECVASKKDYIEALFSDAGFSSVIRGSAEAILGTSFNLEPIIDCLTDSMIVILSQSTNYKIDGVDFQKSLENFMKRDIDALTENCLLENIELIGTERMLNVNRTLFLEKGMLYKNRSNSNVIHLKTYLVCLFEATDGKISSSVFIESINNLTSPMKEIEEACYELSLY